MSNEEEVRAALRTGRVRLARAIARGYLRIIRTIL